MSKNPNAYDFSRWSIKTLGPKPTLEQQAIAHAFGRPGKQTLSLAMRLRPCGATSQQCSDAAGNVYNTKGTTQNNMPNGLRDAGFFTQPVMPAQVGTKHTVYKLVLAPKGEAMMKRTPVYGGLKAEPAKAAPVKAKAKVIPAKLKAARAKADAVSDAAAARGAAAALAPVTEVPAPVEQVTPALAE